MKKPIIALISDALRADSHKPLKYFTKFDVHHFYFVAPYGDVSKQELKNAVQWKSIKDLEEKLVKLKPDLIQGAEPYGSKRQLKICLLVMKLFKKHKIPYFFPMLENRPANNRFGPVIGSIMKKILAKYACSAKLIFYLNKGAKRNLNEVGINDKKLVRALYGLWGVDTGLFKPNFKFTILNFKLKRKYLLFVGRFDEAKGIEYLLYAWNNIKNNYSDIDLVFIGGGKLNHLIKGKQIINLGQMENKNLPPYFAKAICTIYPSITLKRWEEQVGTVNLQSLSCGTPVITTKSGAIPEYISNKVGILVPEKNSKALENAIGKIIKSNSFRANLKKNAREYIIKNFDTQKTIHFVEKELEKIIE